jgi:hypothetical protein
MLYTEVCWYCKDSIFKNNTKYNITIVHPLDCHKKCGNKFFRDNPVTRDDTAETDYRLAEQEEFGR